MSTKHSKFLSLILRHDPSVVGIALDSAGWTDVATLLAACAAKGTSITRDELVQIVATSDKQRFALSPDGTRIRANQGHSVTVELGLARVVPPAQLFHGTVEAALPGIRATGLQKGARHHVHLSGEVDTATKVGGRRGKPVILVVRAAEMATAGHAFYRSENGVWLADLVPAEFIEFPQQHHAGHGSRLAKVAIAKATLVACEAGFYTNPAGDRVELAGAIAHARDGSISHDRAPEATLGSQATRISVTGESTLAAIARLGDGCCALNFASAKNPGGGFLGGAQAQEETLARSSALYVCQLAHPEIYQQQRAHRSALYLDLALYSPGVPVIRDDAGAWFSRPVLASIITCAAPNAGALRQHGRFDAAEVESTLRRRGEMVLAIAAHHGESRLVLGAWGAGVFGNDPVIVARAFRDLLDGAYRGAFAEVVFAVLPGPNHDAFASVFP